MLCYTSRAALGVLCPVLSRKSLSVDQSGFNLSPFQVQISLCDLQFAKMNSRNACLSVSERPALIHQVPPASSRPPGTTLVQYPPSLLMQGGVSEISGRALRVTHWDSNLNCLNLPISSSGTHFKFDKSWPQRSWEVAEVSCRWCSNPGRLSCSGLSAWHVGSAGCLPYFNVEKMYQYNNVFRLEARLSQHSRSSVFREAGFSLQEYRIAGTGDFKVSYNILQGSVCKMTKNVQIQTYTQSPFTAAFCHDFIPKCIHLMNLKCMLDAVISNIITTLSLTLDGDLIYLFGHRLKKMTAWVSPKLSVSLRSCCCVNIKDTSKATQYIKQVQ